MKKKIISKEKTTKRETLVFANPLKMRIPIAPPGFTFKSRKDKGRIHVTIDNWEGM